LENEIKNKIQQFKPDVLLVGKCPMIGPNTINEAKRAGVFTVNRFPDCSPHAHGQRLKKAMGEYDLVLSTKPYHPPGWHGIYGYTNPCICVPHGYSNLTHYWAYPSENQDIDVVLVATWRPQYEELMVTLARELDTSGMSVLIAGMGWGRARRKFPAHWQFMEGIQGRAYGEVLRRGKIVVAPVHREMAIGRDTQPGDEDTTRTYELAAASCFFLHRRTPYVQTLYSETHEVPMWDDAAELATLIRRFLPLPDERRRMAEAAHRRAVPAYSVAARTAESLQIIRSAMGGATDRSAD